MKTIQNNDKIKVDTFDLVQAIIQGQKFQKLSDEDMDLLMLHYETNLRNDIRKKRYSSTVRVTDLVKNVMNAV